MSRLFVFRAEVVTILVSVVLLSGMDGIAGQDYSSFQDTIGDQDRHFVHAMALKDVAQAAQRSVQTGQCTPETSIFAYDIDDTVRYFSVSSVDDEDRDREGKEHARIISALAYSGFTTIAVTARPAKPFVSDLTMDQLDSLGFDLENGTRKLDRSLTSYQIVSESLMDEDGYFSINPFRKPKSFNSLLYHGGVLFVHNHGKGPALKRLLEIAGLLDQYRCLFFVDDLEKNLISVQDAFKESHPKSFMFWAQWYR